MSIIVDFFVPGVPKPAGSKTATAIRNRNGSVRMIPLPGGKSRPMIVTRDDCNNVDWKNSVRVFARQAFQGTPVVGSPLRLVVEFHMPRRAGDYGTGKNAGVLKATAPVYHTVKPDATKLLRCVEDAMTGIVYAADEAVARQSVVKMYSETPGAFIRVETIE